MRQSRRQAAQIVEHDDQESGLQNPDDFLDRNHPENDDYMKAVEHVQRKIMHQSSLLRSKQINILKAVFAGSNYTQAAAANHCVPSTVARLVKSPNGQRLLNLLQYHLKLLEGPGEAQRRNMAWRIAVNQELLNPKTSLAALELLSKMHFQQVALDNPLPNGTAPPAPQVIIQINQELLPRGALDG